MTFLPSVPALLSSLGCCRARSAAGRAGGAVLERGVEARPLDVPRGVPSAPPHPACIAGRSGKESGPGRRRGGAPAHGGGTEECALGTREKRQRLGYF